MGKLKIQAIMRLFPTVLLPLAAVLLTGLWMMTRQGERLSSKSLQNMAALKADLVADRLESRRSWMEIAAKSPILTEYLQALSSGEDSGGPRSGLPERLDLLRQEADVELKKQTASGSSSLWKELVLCDPLGVAAAVSGEEDALFPYGHGFADASQLAEGQYQVSMEKRQGESIVCLSVPIYQDGVYLGRLTGAAGPEIWGKAQEDARCFTTILTEDDKILYTEDGELSGTIQNISVNNTLLPQWEALDFEQTSQGVFSYETNGIKKLAAYAEIKDAGLRLLMTQDRSVIFAAGKKDYTVFALVAVGIALAGILLGLSSVKTRFRLAEQLNKTLAQLSGGNLSVRFPSCRSGLMKYAAKSFNSLLESLEREKQQYQRTYEDYRTLTSQIPGGAVQCEPGGSYRIREISGGILQLLDYTWEEIDSLYQSSLLNMVYPGDREETQRALDSLIREGGKAALEFRILLQKDQFLWVLCRAALVEDSEKKTRKLYCVITDQSHSREQREQLHLCQEELNFFLQQSGEILSVYDIPSDTLSYSPQWMRVLGYHPPSKGLRSYLLEDGNIHPEDLPILEAWQNSPRDFRSQDALPIRLRTIDGRYLWMNLCLERVMGQDNRPVRILCTLYPILPEERANQSLLGRDPSASFLEYILNLLCLSSDPRQSVSLALETIGKRFGVSSVYIFQNSEDDTECSNTYEWCAGGISPQKATLQHLSYQTVLAGLVEQYDERGVFYCADTGSLPENIQALLHPQGIRSMLHCAIKDGARFRGFVGFDDNTGNRVWSKEEISTLFYAAKIIGLFLLGQEAKQQQSRLSGILQEILDRQESWVYVIDEEYRLKFINQRTQILVPDAKPGLPCYQYFGKAQGHICEECPVAKLARISRGRQEREWMSREFYQPNLKIWMTVEVAMLTCPDGSGERDKRYYYIQCRYLNKGPAKDSNHAAGGPSLEDTCGELEVSGG